MKPLNPDKVLDYVNIHITEFHVARLKTLEKLNLSRLLRQKNPYLFRAKNINTPAELVNSLLDALLSSSEEKLFGDFLEDLAIFVAGETCGGRKSAAQGIDLEFEQDGVHYLVSIKSGTSWGNSSQHRRQEEDFKTAVRVLKQSSHTLNVQPVLGICYGKTRTSYPRGYMKVVGQSFWYLISGDPDLYKQIILPIGYEAPAHNAHFEVARQQIADIFTQDLLKRFCDSGVINWEKIVEYNSANMG